MSKIFTFVSILLLAGSFSSCKKCYQCIAKDDEGNAVSNYLEICGTKGDFEHYQDRCEAEWGTFGFSCVCAEVE